MDAKESLRQEPRKYKVRVGGPCFPAGVSQPCPWQAGVQVLQVRVVFWSSPFWL